MSQLHEDWYCPNEYPPAQGQKVRVKAACEFDAFYLPDRDIHAPWMGTISDGKAKILAWKPIDNTRDEPQTKEERDEPTN